MFYFDWCWPSTTLRSVLSNGRDTSYVLLKILPDVGISGNILWIISDWQRSVNKLPQDKRRNTLDVTSAELDEVRNRDTLGVYIRLFSGGNWIYTTVPLWYFFYDQNSQACFQGHLRASVRWQTRCRWYMFIREIQIMFDKFYINVPHWAFYWSKKLHASSSLDTQLLPSHRQIHS